MKSFSTAVLFALLLVLAARNDAHPLQTRRYILQKRLDGCPCDIQFSGYAKVPSMISVEIILIAEYRDWVAKGRPVRPAHLTKLDQGFCMETSMKASGDYMMLVGSDHDDDAALIDVERAPCKAVSIVDFNDDHDDHDDDDDDECDAEESEDESANIQLSVSQRIVNGSYVYKEKVGRYNVLIYHRTELSPNKGYLLCSGSLIGEQWVLTAAHCKVALNDKVIVGKHLGAKGEEIKVIDMISHEKYKPEHHGKKSITAELHDIQLLKLEHKAKNAKEHMIAINTDCKRPVACRFAQVSGYGLSTASNKTVDRGMCGSDVLRSTFVKVISNRECHRRLMLFRANLAERDLDRSPHICAVHDACGSGTCSGDSGGPLVVADGDDGTFVQIGITSYHFGSCAEREHPDVYTKVSNYARWIKDNTEGVKMNPDFLERDESCKMKPFSETDRQEFRNILVAQGRNVTECDDDDPDCQGWDDKTWPTPTPRGWDYVASLT